MKIKTKSFCILILFVIINFLTITLVHSQMKNYCITYQLSMPNPNTHYFEVEMDVDLLNSTYTFQNTSFIDFKLPVWTPGSYLIREYAKNIEGFAAFSDNNILKSSKIDKNTWRIIKEKNTSLRIKYKVASMSNPKNRI